MMISVCVCVQAPAEYLQKQHDTKIQQDEFTLYYRTLEIRFPIDKQVYANTKSVTLRCVARMEQYPKQVRESSQHFFISSSTQNEKLVRNSATGKSRYISSVLCWFFFIVELALNREIAH